MGRLELRKAHEILSRSYAYGISYDQLRRVALQLYGESLVYYDERPDGDVSIRIRPRAREYYYSNLSTIPKEKRYSLREISSNSIIASLDEGFVANLEPGASFLAKGQPWQVIDISEKEVLAQPSFASDIAIPEWTGEDIPVSFEVAQGVGVLRNSVKNDVKPLPDDKTVIIEIVSDIVIVHGCFGTRVNEGLARLFSANLSRIIGESVRAVADPYRIMVKLPFPLGEEHILHAWDSIKSVRGPLEEALSESYLLKMRFIHVGRLFGMLSEDATVSGRFISALRYSAVYDEAVRSVFSRYFDVKRTEDVLGRIARKEMLLVVDKRAKPSHFAKLGLDRLSSKEAMGGFEPREQMVAAFRERALSKTLQLRCMNCGATRYLHLAGAPDQLPCHKCGEKAYALIEREGEDEAELRFKAGLIRAYGKKALIALSTYGVGATTADRVLRKLHRDEQGFYLDLIEAQKNFIKNKRFWKP
jgi:ATP-dependent Lhr-like helicase